MSFQVIDNVLKFHSSDSFVPKKNGFSSRHVENTCSYLMVLENIGNGSIHKVILKQFLLKKKKKIKRITEKKQKPHQVHKEMPRTLAFQIAGLPVTSVVARTLLRDGWNWKCKRTVRALVHGIVNDKLYRAREHSQGTAMPWCRQELILWLKKGTVFLQSTETILKAMLPLAQCKRDESLYQPMLDVTKSSIRHRETQAKKKINKAQVCQKPNPPPS